MGDSASRAAAIGPGIGAGGALLGGAMDQFIFQPQQNKAQGRQAAQINDALKLLMGKNLNVGSARFSPISAGRVSYNPVSTKGTRIGYKPVASDFSKDRNWGLDIQASRAASQGMGMLSGELGASGLGRSSLGTNARNELALGVLSDLAVQRQEDKLFRGQLDSDIDRFNAGNMLAKDQFNAGNLLATRQFNAGNQLAAGQFNVGNQMAARQFNAQNQLATQQFNIGNQMGANAMDMQRALAALQARQHPGFGYYNAQTGKTRGK